VHAPAELSAERMLDLMSVDKKVKDGKIRLILLEAIGRAVITADYDRDKLIETLSSCRAAA
jgi:3-dehydroquinate synthase